MSGFGFISPLLLGLSALAVPIVLLYMLRLRRTDVPISSTFLWQQLVRDREANAPWQKLRPNWLLLLQLLILLALVLALARPYREVKTITTGRIVLLLDASASMNATDIEDAQTRFEQAQELALETVDSLGSDDTMTVIRVAETPEVLASATRDRSILRDAIGDAEPSQGSADWTGAFTLAAAGARGVDTLTVVVLSDGGVPDNLPQIPGEFKYVRVGEASNNVAISALSIRSLPSQSPQLFAQLTNYGVEDTTVILELHLDGQLYNSQFYDIPARTAIDIIRDDITGNFTQLEARVSRPSSSDVPDHLASDNTAYAVNTETSTGNILVMTERNRFLETAFAVQQGIDATKGDPERGLPGGDYDLIVLDRWLPDGPLPETDLLIIAPPESTSLFQVTGESTDSAIDPLTGGVRRDDERTRFVDFSNVRINKFLTVDNIAWATILVETEDGLPLVLAGEQDGRQVVVFTFALQDSDLPLQIAWPILIGRLLEWYQPQRAISIDSLIPGQTLTVRPTVDADAVRIEYPDGESVDLSLDEDATAVFADTEAPGFYQIEVLLDGEVVQRDTFAVNLFDVRESDIAPANELRIETREGDELTISSTAQEETGRRELWRYLAYAGLLILGIEWWWYHRTLHRKPKAMTETLFQQRTETPRRWRWLRGQSR